jgi:hypothetical protein
MYTQQIVNFLAGHVGRVPYAIISLAFLLVVPVLLSVLFILVLVRAQGRTRQGLLLGVGAATWASICWLTVPYLGGYPCLPGLVVKGLLIRWGPVETAAEEITVHLTNFIIWPLFGSSIIWLQRTLLKHGVQSARGGAAPPVAPA